jgi:hypothetical protein
MKGFVLGLVVAALAFGGYMVWKSREAQEKPAISAADAGAPSKRKRKRGRGAARVARARPESSGSSGAVAGGVPREEPEAEPEPEPIKLTAADRKMVGQGDDLGRPDVVRMDLSNNEATRELTQEDIDSSFRAQEEAILTCISQARPDAEAYVPGLVNVKFRIQRQGTVRGVRVEAPSILQKGGLYSCVKAVVERIRFPPSGSSQIVTYPFRLS